jgi:uncharacterized coiled-coil DUF342 family protein
MTALKLTAPAETICAEYEAGQTVSALARQFGCSRGAIQKHIEAGQWTQNLEPAIERQTMAKVAGIVAGSTPQKRAEAITTEADRRAAVALRHRDEWDEHAKLIHQAIAQRDLELAKMAKITAETIKIRQEAERKAWGLDQTAKTEASSTPTFVVVRVNEKSQQVED